MKYVFICLFGLFAIGCKENERLIVRDIESNIKCVAVAPYPNPFTKGDTVWVYLDTKEIMNETWSLSTMTHFKKFVVVDNLNKPSHD